MSARTGAHPKLKLLPEDPLLNWGMCVLGTGAKRVQWIARVAFLARPEAVPNDTT